MRDALTPSLACAAAHTGDLEALQALAERVSPQPPWGPAQPGWAKGGRGVFLGFHSTPVPGHQAAQPAAAKGAQWLCQAPPRVHPAPACPFPVAHLTLPSPSSGGTCPYVAPGQ